MWVVWWWWVVAGVLDLEGVLDDISLKHGAPVEDGLGQGDHRRRVVRGRRLQPIRRLLLRDALHLRLGRGSLAGRLRHQGGQQGDPVRRWRNW